MELDCLQKVWSLKWRPSKMWNHSYCGQQPKTLYLLLLFCLVGSLIVKGRPPIHLVLFCCMFVVCFFFCSWNIIFQNGEYWPSVLPMANSFLPWDRESDEVSKFRNNYKLLKLIWRFSFPKRQLQMKSKNLSKILPKAQQTKADISQHQEHRQLCTFIMMVYFVA